MRRIFLSLVILCATVVGAVNYTDITITSSANQLPSELKALLPANFSSSVFSGSTPVMDRLFIFMTAPSGFSNYKIDDPNIRIILSPKNPSNLRDGFDMSTENPSFTLKAGKDVLFSFVKDGSQYVLDRLPFDPTLKAIDEIFVGDHTTEKIYITGSTTQKLCAEFPERVKIIAPAYLKSLEQSLSDLFVAYIDNTVVQTVTNMVEDMHKNGLMSDDDYNNFTFDFSFNPNCEGFFQFTGDVATHLHLYTEDLSMKVKDKKNDFLGTNIAAIATINLSGLESIEDNTETWNGNLSDKDASWVEARSEQEIRAMTLTQIQNIATKMTEAQCGYLTTGQLLGLLGFTDISQAFTTPSSDIGTALYLIFQDADKATAAGKNLKGITDKLLPLLAPIQQNPLSIMGNLDFDLIFKLFSSFVEGTASPFAFKSNSQLLDNNAFHVHIHSKGENTITGGAVADFKNTGVEMNMLLEMLNFGSNPQMKSMVEDLAIMFEAVVKFSSAPFSVRPSDDKKKSDDVDNYNYTCTRLLFDDIWVDGSTHTNGLMQMPVVSSEPDAPSIDIGTRNGQVEFNGGRYKFHTSVSSLSNMFFVATMAICYREFSVNMPLAGPVTYLGIGTSVGWGPQQNRSDYYKNVIIRDGTFSTYQPAPQYAVDRGWYKHRTDIRMPYNTSVLGGTFPDDTYVYRCDAAAEPGVDPVYIYQADEDSPPQFTSLCIRKEVPAPSLSESYVIGQNTPVVVDNDKESELLFDVNGTSTKWNYGHSGMVADANGKLWLYVPGDCTVDYTYTRNYVTALSPFGESKSETIMLSMGDDTEAKSLYQDNPNFPMKNAYLLYTQLGYYTFYNAGVNLGGLFRTLREEFQINRAKHHNFSSVSTETNAAGQSMIKTNDTTGVVFAEITNKDSYKIEYGLYMMLPARSNEWMLISPPFDVANVYILETTNERGNYSWNDAQWYAYYQRQGEADGDMAQALVTSVLPDVFSGRGSGILRPLPDILNDINSSTKLTKLTHYDGSNFMTANFYLNEMVADAEPNKWEMEDDINKYGNKWTAAPAQSTPTFLTSLVPNPVPCDCDPLYDDDCECEDYISVTLPYVKQDGTEQEQQYCIMKSGSVYSMFFPGGNNRFYNYKYLIFEGYGPQRVKGENEHINFMHPDPSSATYSNHPGSNYIALQGNTTFANDTITGISSTHPLFYARRTQTGSYPTGSIIYDFAAKNTATQTLLPTRVVMISDNNKSVKASMPALKNEPTDMGNIPTLADEAIQVWTDNGIYINAMVPQHISVYTLDGRTLWSGEVSKGTTQFVPADRGMYVVQGETTAVKVVN